MAIITLRQMRQMPYTEIDEKKLYTKILFKKYII